MEGQTHAIEYAVTLNPQASLMRSAQAFVDVGSQSAKEAVQVSLLDDSGTPKKVGESALNVLSLLAGIKNPRLHIEGPTTDLVNAVRERIEAIGLFLKS